MAEGVEALGSTDRFDAIPITSTAITADELSLFEVVNAQKIATFPVPTICAGPSAQDDRVKYGKTSLL